MDEKQSEMVKTNRLPRVGDVVTSKSLKLQRLVTDFDGKTITLKALRTGFYTSLFDLLSFDFQKTMSLEDFEVGYNMPAEVKVIKHEFSAEELNTTFMKVGQIYKQLDTGERVMLGINRVNGKGERCVELHSLDQMVEGEYLLYHVTEVYFKLNFKEVGIKNRFKTTLSLSS